MSLKQIEKENTPITAISKCENEELLNNKIENREKQKESNISDNDEKVLLNETSS